MKKLLAVILILCVFVSLIMAMTGCSMNSTPSRISKNYPNLAKGYKADVKKGGEGDSATFTFDSAKTFNSIVFKENGSNIIDYELYADGEMFYKSDFIGKYKYCSHKTLTASSITLKVVACDKDWSIKDIEVYNIVGSAKQDFEVMSYLLVDRAYTLTPKSAALMSHTTQFNLFGSVYLDKDGHLHFQDYLFDGKSVEGRTVLKKAVEKVREYNPSAKIVYTILGNLDINGDGLDTQDRHSGAMGKNANTLVKECLDVMEEYGFDGISFDYEYPYTHNANTTYGKFLEKLKKAMPDGKSLSAAFSMWSFTSAVGFPLSKLDFLDNIEIMTYDGFDDRGNHSAFYKMCAEALYQLDKKGVDMNKVHLGLPFYSRPIDKAGYWGVYADVSQQLGVWGNSIVEDVNAGEGETYQQKCYYNGRQMIYDKTCYAIDTGVGGVMIWHYSCDTTDSELSLYGAISEAVNSRAIS